jgi:hypothetical protein
MGLILALLFWSHVSGVVVDHNDAILSGLTVIAQTEVCGAANDD